MNHEERIELLSRVAITHARAARFSQAKEAIEQARLIAGNSGTAATLWIMLAEGVLLLFQDQSPSALARVRASVALGKSLAYSRFVALAAAWQAHMEFEGSHFKAMIDSIRVASEHMSSTNVEALSRISIVIANGYALCAQTKRAREWFARGHRAAVASGDQASIEALLFNRVTLALSALRVERCFHDLASESVNALRSELRSIWNWNALIKGSALFDHLRLVDARLHILEKEFLVAAQKLEDLRIAHPFAANHLSASFLELEICYCWYRASHSQVAIDGLLNRGLQLSFEALELDDQIVANWMLAFLAGHGDRLGSVEAYKQQLGTLRQTYEKEQTELVRELDSLTSEFSKSVLAT